MLPRFLSGPAFDQMCLRLSLSERERDIVHHLFRDAKESAIAHNLAMSPHTLRTHIERLYRKLAVTRRTELIVRLYECYLNLTGEPDSSLPPVCGTRSAGHCQWRR